MRREDGEFLESKGWSRVPWFLPASRITVYFWKDPLRDREPLWAHEAVRVQKRRESVVRKIMES